MWLADVAEAFDDFYVGGAPGGEETADDPDEKGDGHYSEDGG